MKERYKSLVAVFLILTRTSKDGNSKEILLQKRENTGYMDDYYDLGVSGHLEENESVKDTIIRESIEEANIKVDANDLKLVTVFNEKTNSLEYLRFFFHTEIYEGEILIGEPTKCSEMGWYSIDSLPNNVIPHVRKAINNFQNGISYEENGFK
ncbi:MAG: NUDIX domain-containing protein [Clostridia bacterium]|nr:NUDIX domain-containing protein [Clostridia bacterium]MDD4386921.1 NUDIX domain-containing protein [Clostridia bacterium]